MRALQSANNQHDYVFPMENTSERHKIEKNGFILDSWLSIENTSHEGLDKHDCFSVDTGKTIIRIGDKVKKILPISFSNNFKKGFNEDKLISSFKNWNDITDQRYRDSNLIESGGEILKVNKDFILKMLKKTNKNLIIKCQIERQLKKTVYWRDNIETPWETTKIYLINSDGEIKTIRG